MRELRRPTLFMMARLSLFLAVVALIVGGDYSLYVNIPRQGTTAIVVGFDESKWVSGHTPKDFVGGWSCELRKEWLSYDTVRRCMMNEGKAVFFDYFVSFPHSLIITILVLFNIGLHGFYQNRPEAQPSESE